MGRLGKRKKSRHILGMILVPVLLVLLLFCFSEKQSGGGDKGEAVRKESPAKEASEKEAAGLSEQADAGKTKEGAPKASGALYDPVQEIAFVPSGSENRLQRSVPVDIDAAILGGQAGTRCWAVFLPSEMREDPVIVFSQYDKVLLEPLRGSDRLGTGRLGTGRSADNKAGRGPAASADVPGEMETEGAGTDWESREYSSGDRVEGLANGSAFRIHMISKEGEEKATDLYVYSCEGMASLYLDTESGHMENIDGDLNKRTAEQAQFAVFRPDGAPDASGRCRVRGRGNSSWGMKKRPYNLNLEEKQSVLGIKECKKLCLLANVFDQTNLLDRISSQMALQLEMRDTPEGEFVNLYLNGKYNGLYYLSQRPRTGGSVNIKKLDKKILKANGLLTEEEKKAATEEFEEDGEYGPYKESGEAARGSADAGEEEEGSEESADSKKAGTGSIPKKIPLHEDGSRQKKWAYNWPNEPKNNTGGYLLQQYSRYDGDRCWFSTLHRRFRIMSPSYPTPGEVEYLSDYMLSAERAIYSEDGIDKETGKNYRAFLDMPSWEDMFLLEEFFAEWDAERWSFYIIKDRDDPLLYCGPMWDFDHSAGLMLYGNYPETAVSMLLFRDTRHGWMYKLLSHDEFVDDLYSRWRDRFSPLIHEYLDGKLDREIAAIESAAYMNNIRRANDYDYREKTDALKTWLQRRLDFLDDYTGSEEGKPSSANYCRVAYEFSWGTLSHYVVRGEELGYLPLPEYGETQIPSQIEKNEIIGWQDEEGKEIGPDIVIDGDRTFRPVYR